LDSIHFHFDFGFMLILPIGFHWLIGIIGWKCAQFMAVAVRLSSFSFLQGINRPTDVALGGV